ncbi:response regulator [Sandaracinus amylolyticus]|uniref:Sensory box histidine kinase/response regulator n=1 Tax=Sandaracinus amylolyticus TaxID=927083 RepID=A0A0F6W4N3_9BACT|nr:response regulator [Sandaracinus amylolyticus]AKF07375.1 Sensory box histidine kinase/response regulator [Sandaracinus amylolyticus]
MSADVESSDAPILVVEDDADVRDTMVQVLESEGHAVRGARDGREALDALRAGLRPRLILLDLMMPVMNGWQFREEMEREPALASIPVVLVSALDPGTERTASIAAAGFLHKPFELDELLDAVQRAIAHPA